LIKNSGKFVLDEFTFDARKKPGEGLVKQGEKNGGVIERGRTWG